MPPNEWVVAARVLLKRLRDLNAGRGGYDGIPESSNPVAFTATRSAASVRERIREGCALALVCERARRRGARRGIAPARPRCLSESTSPSAGPRSAPCSSCLAGRAESCPPSRPPRLPRCRRQACNGRRMCQPRGGSPALRRGRTPPRCSENLTPACLPTSQLFFRGSMKPPLASRTHGERRPGTEGLAGIDGLPPSWRRR